jgi:hypothetical protein
MPDPKLYIEVLNDGSQDLYIRDAEAQEEIANIKNTIKNGASYIGKFVSAVVGGETVDELHQGDVVTSITTTKGTFVPGTPSTGQTKLNEGDYVEVQGASGKPSMEYMWNGSAMDEFGSTSLLKSFAFKDSASGSYTPAGSNAPSAVSFTGQTDGDFVTGFDTAPVLPSLGNATTGTFVTGYNDDAVAPSLGDATTGQFVTGYNNDGVAPSLGDATTGTFVTGYNSDGVAPSKAADTFTQGTLPSMTYDETNRKLTFGAGTLPTFQEGAFSAGSAATLATASAVTAQGTFSAGSAATLAKSAAVTAQGTFSAGSAATLATASAVTAQGTFSAGTAPTLATGKAITAVGTGEAAAQTFTGTAATITVS